MLMNQSQDKMQRILLKNDFYKLMNNSNFGYDCRDNLDNCQFVPIYNELKEITYIKKHYNFFDPKVSKFVTFDLIAQEIEEKYNNDMSKLSKEEKFFKIKKSAIDRERESTSFRLTERVR